MTNSPFRRAVATVTSLVLGLVLALVAVPAAHAAASDDATLSGLTVSTGTFDAPFDPSGTMSNVTVTHDTTFFAFTPTANDADATITTWNGNVSAATPSGTPTAASWLQRGPNIMTATVTAADGTTQKQYVLVVTKPASPAPVFNLDLTELTVSEGELTPEFSPGVSTYTVDVPYTTNRIAFTAAAADTGNDVTVVGASTGPVTDDMFLAVGTNTALITVTAPDQTSKVTTVHVTRGPVPTADVDLTGIELSAGTLSPSFDPAVQTYTALVPYAVRSIGISATASTPGHTMTINNQPMTDGVPVAVPLNFDAQGSGFAISVKADNGVEKIYTVVITRDQPSDNADLTGLSLSDAVFAPEFANEETDYTATVPYLTTQTSVTATVADATAILRVNHRDTASGEASAPIALQVGANPITVTVTAEDSVTETTRTIVVTREAPDLDLSALRVTGGTLSPEFGAATTDYTLALPYRVSSVDVAATAVEADWTLEIDGVETDAATVDVPVGESTITVRVTALYGESRDVTVTVTREAATAAALALDLGFGTGDVAANAPFTAAGSHLLPGSTATVTVHSTPAVLATGTVSADGTIALGARLPATLEAGAHRLVLEGIAEDGTAATATAWFTVLRDGTIGAVSLTGPVAYVEPATPAAAAPASTLAKTGVAGDQAALLAALLAGAGALLLLGGAFRRRSSL